MVVENQMELESPYSSKQLINMKMDDQNSLYGISWMEKGAFLHTYKILIS